MDDSALHLLMESGLPRTKQGFAHPVLLLEWAREGTIPLSDYWQR